MTSKTKRLAVSISSIRQALELLAWAKKLAK